MCQTPVVTKKHTGCLSNMLSLQDSCTLLFEENKKGGGRDNFNAAWKGQHWSSHCSDSSRIVYTKLVHNFAQRLSLYTVQNNNGVSFNCWSTTHCTSKCTLTHLRWSQLRKSGDNSQMRKKPTTLSTWTAPALVPNQVIGPTSTYREPATKLASWGKDIHTRAYPLRKV